jgi:DNA-binding winged helix-turn-helix (wHTH) protein
MGQEPSRSRRIVIGPVQLDPDSGHIWKDGGSSYLPEQPLAVLRALLDARGGVVSREALRNRLWPDDINVDYEHGLNAAVKRLREALGDSADTPQFIETIPRRGYRLIAPLDDATETSPWCWRRVLPPVPVAAGLLVLVAVGLVLFAHLSVRDVAAPLESAAGVTRLTHDGGLTMQPSLDLWLQRSGAPDPVRLTSDPFRHAAGRRQRSSTWRRHRPRSRSRVAGFNQRSGAATP